MSRFLLVLGHQVRGRLAPPWPGAGRPDRPQVRDGEWVAWRLLGSNHRELARSACVFVSADAACSAVARLRHDVGRAVVATATVNGLWSWQLSIADEAVAVASRLYQRPRECAYNLAAALAAVSAVDVVDALPRWPRQPAGPTRELNDV